MKKPLTKVAGQIAKLYGKTQKTVLKDRIKTRKKP